MKWYSRRLLTKVECSMRFEGADGIRGLACLIVLCTHAVAMFFNSTYMALAGMGKVGVWLFFVLSAFLCNNSKLWLCAPMDDSS